MNHPHRIALLVLLIPFAVAAENGELFTPRDVFELEWASEPKLDPNGERIVYVRNFMDIMNDRRRSNLWLIDLTTGEHQPLTSGTNKHHSPRWSPSGDRLAWISGRGEAPQLWMRWMDSGRSARITNLTRSPGGLSWSPGGEWLALTLPVEEEKKPLAQMPDQPEGADWAKSAQVIERVHYRADGAGYLADAWRQVFVVPAEGGTPRQLTRGSFDHGGQPVWTPDGEALILSANRHDNHQHEPLNSELYRLDVDSGEIEPLTGRYGPDSNPAISPDGKRIAYIGFDDEHQGYQLNQVYVMELEGGQSELLTGSFDRSVNDVTWAANGQSLLIDYTDHGRGKVARLALDGDLEVLVEDLGGTSLGRPYGGGSFSAANGKVAFTHTGPHHPADVGVVDGDGMRRLTRLNRDLLGPKTLGQVESIEYKSSVDGREIQGWIIKPPEFDPNKDYPLLLEIHGGPFADYGPRFAAELQLYAAAGYVVLYTNPRGSTSYGKEFGNLIHHAYPGNDFHDLMSGVDAVIERGYIDADRLFITGGSGGGVLSAWAVGHTDRFRAAAVQKPVINWYSFVLTADSYTFFHRYWFPALPWEQPQAYLDRSPISHVGNVATPTMLITGESDYRTPISETEQFYQALRLRKVPSAMVRLPGASHGIASRPSQLIAKVQHILGWFDRYDNDSESGEEDS